MGKVADSRMPSEFDEDWGSNWMMDGFWHDMDYGSGIEDSGPSTPIPQPSTNGFAHLPDGVLIGASKRPLHVGAFVEEEGGLDLGGLGLVEPAQPEVNLVDHSWLTDVVQSAERLPENPTEKGLRELQKEWADRMEGPQRINATERRAQVHAAAAADELSHERLVSVLRSAMRRSAAGEPLTSIREAVRASLGDAARLLAVPLRAVEAEHGLVGTVYVRATAFPGQHRGKWAAAFKRACRSARYLVGCENCETCACAMGMKRVESPDEIDWDEAYRAYAPRLRATGRLERLASGGKREALRQAFLAPATVSKPTRQFPVVPAPAMADAAEARSRLRDLAPRSVAVLPPRTLGHRAEARLTRRVGAMVRARLITEQDARRLLETERSVAVRIREADALASRVVSATYGGPSVRDPRAAFPNAEALPRRLVAATSQASPDRDPRELLYGLRQAGANRAKLATKVRAFKRAAAEGLRGNALRRRADALFEPDERSRVAGEIDAILVKGGAFDPKPRHKVAYRGPVLTQATPEARDSKATDRQVRAAVRWFKRALNEGHVGQALDRMLANRVSPEVWEVAGNRLQRLRAAREGVAGTLYIEADVYATPKGTTGCEDGASVHRGSDVPYVLAMKRCASCVFRNADSVCQKYNKTLVSEVSPQLADRVRRKRLAVVQAPRGAVEDPVAAFGLAQSPLDHIATESPASAQDINDISFGGLEL